MYTELAAKTVKDIYKAQLDFVSRLLETNHRTLDAYRTVVEGLVEGNRALLGGGAMGLWERSPRRDEERWRDAVGYLKGISAEDE